MHELTSRDEGASSEKRRPRRAWDVHPVRDLGGAGLRALQQPSGGREVREVRDLRDVRDVREVRDLRGRRGAAPSR